MDRRLREGACTRLLVVGLGVVRHGVAVARGWADMATAAALRIGQGGGGGGHQPLSQTYTCRTSSRGAGTNGANAVVVGCGPCDTPSALFLSHTGVIEGRGGVSSLPFPKINPRQTRMRLKCSSRGVCVSQRTKHCTCHARHKVGSVAHRVWRCSPLSPGGSCALLSRDRLTRVSRVFHWQ